MPADDSRKGNSNSRTVLGESLAESPETNKRPSVKAKSVIDSSLSDWVTFVRTPIRRQISWFSIEPSVSGTLGPRFKSNSSKKRRNRTPKGLSMRQAFFHDTHTTHQQANPTYLIIKSVSGTKDFIFFLLIAARFVTKLPRRIYLQCPRFLRDIAVGR